MIETNIVPSATPAPTTTTPATVPSPPGCQPPARKSAPVGLRFTAKARWQLENLVATVNHAGALPDSPLSTLITGTPPAQSDNTPAAQQFRIVQAAVNLVWEVNIANRSSSIQANI